MSRRDQAGMLRSSELVMKLHGSDTEQAADTDGAYELVFGRSMGEPLVGVVPHASRSAALPLLSTLSRLTRLVLVTG